MDHTHLCDVITMHRPSARTRDSASHNNFLATGSMPVVGSSKNTTGGSPTNDMAVLNFRLFPPLGRRDLKISLSEEPIT